MSKQIGSYNDDGSIKEWPEQDIDGRDFEKHQTRADLGGGKFVVLPVNFTDWDRVEKLRQQYKPASPEAFTVTEETPSPISRRARSES